MLRDRAESVPHVSLPDAIRKSAWRGSRIGGSPRLLDDFDPDCRHIATEGTLGAGRAHAGVCGTGCRVHDVVSHAVPGIRARARADSAGAELCASASAFIGARAAHDGRDAGDAAAARSARLSQHRALDARRGRGAVQARGQGIPGIAATDLRCTSGASRWRRTSRRFCALDLPGTKVVVGDGPARADCSADIRRREFVGYKFGDELAAHIAAADVFVFPSRTDTFGLVLLEALACGVPVAAYPVTGPIDVVQDGVTGVLDEDLRAATLRALQLDPSNAVHMRSSTRGKRRRNSSCRILLLVRTRAVQRESAAERPRRSITTLAQCRLRARLCFAAPRLFLPRARSESAIRRHAADCARGALTDIDTALRPMFSACT